MLNYSHNEAQQVVNLIRLLIFQNSFRGSPQDPSSGFDLTAQAIARNGQYFVERMYRLQDLQLYMMRLFLEYAVSWFPVLGRSGQVIVNKYPRC